MNNNLLSDLQESIFGQNVTMCKEITLFSIEDIKEMESVKQTLSGITRVNGENKVYYYFTVFTGNPYAVENAKPIYNFVLIDNKLYKLN